MLPLLQFFSDKKEHAIKEAIDHISKKFNLTEEEKRELLPSGKQPIIINRVGWAKTYMKKAGLLDNPSWGYVRITERGEKVLNQNPQKIDVKFLGKYPEFIEFQTIKKKPDIGPTPTDIPEDITPDELMDRGSKLINSSLTLELLEKLYECDPYFFEQVIGDLLSSMGYGECEITPKSGDGGIDGIVNQDKLGLDRIFFQAKRYDKSNTVTARDVRDFVGTLDLHGVQKGIFITTSKFPKDTKEILKKTPKNIILINGSRLAQLMIDHDIGVSTEKVYKVKKLDSDYFIQN